MEREFEDHHQCMETIANLLMEVIPEPWNDIELEVTRESLGELEFLASYKPRKGGERQDLEVPYELGPWFMELGELVGRPQNGTYKACRFSVTSDRQYKAEFVYGPPKRTDIVRQFKSTEECSTAIASALAEVVHEPWESIYVDFEMIDRPEGDHCMCNYQPCSGGELRDIAVPPSIRPWFIELLDLASEADEVPYRRFILDWCGGSNLDVAFYTRGLFG
jgi:hypothetical protein